MYTVQNFVICKTCFHIHPVMGVTAILWGEQTGVVSKKSQPWPRRTAVYMDLEPP